MGETMQKLIYTIKQSFKSIGKNKIYTLASVGTITACLFLFGVFYMLASNLTYMIEKAEASMSITVLFQKGIEKDRIDELYETISAQPEVNTIVYITAEEAWEKFQKEIFNNNEELASAFEGDNPLADSESFEITTNKIEEQEKMVEYIRELEGVRQVNSAEYTVKSLANFNSMLTYLTGAIIGILVLVSLFLISITVSVGISRRKDEISIMQMLGADDIMIKGPYMAEGIFIGGLGALFPLIILKLLYQWVMNYLLERFSMISGLLSFLTPKEIFLVLIPAIIIIGVGIGFLGSYMTVHKYIKGEVTGK